MKKLALIGVLLLLSTGCRSGFLSGCRRGAPCRSGCEAPAQAAPDCCQSSYSSGYGSYDSGATGEYYGGEIVGGDYYGGQVVPGSTRVLEGVPSAGSTITPPMSSIQPAS